MLINHEHHEKFNIVKTIYPTLTPPNKTLCPPPSPIQNGLLDPNLSISCKIASISDQRSKRKYDMCKCKFSYYE